MNLSRHPGASPALALRPLMQAMEPRIMLAADIAVHLGGAPDLISGQFTAARLHSVQAAYGDPPAYLEGVFVRNDGDATLNVSDIHFSAGSPFAIDTNPGFSSGPPFSVNPGEEKFVALSLDAFDAGTKSAVVTVNSDDPDEGVFTFPIQALAYGGAGDRDLGVVSTTPVIDTADLHFRGTGYSTAFASNIQRFIAPGTRLLRFDIDQPRASVNLDFKSKASNATAASSFPTTTLSLFKDDGDGVLDAPDKLDAPLASISQLNSNPSVFQTGSSNVTLGRGTYFVLITQRPPADQLGDLQVDGTCTLTTTATPVPAPSLVIRGNGLAIASADDTPSTADGTDFGTVPFSSTQVTHSFKLVNTGTAKLVIKSIHADSLGIGSDSQTVSGPAELAAGASADISVTLKRSGLDGKRLADLVVESDDPDNPYYYVGLQADFQATPLSFTTDAGTYLGRVQQNSIVQRKVRLTNTGSTTIPLSLAPDAGLQLLASPTSIAAHSTIEIPVKFDTSKIGDIAPALTINNSGRQLVIGFSGTILAPAVVILDSIRGVTGQSPDGSSTGFAAPDFSTPVDLGTTTVGAASAVRTFRIRNTAGVALYLGKVAASAGFAITRQLPWRLEAGQVGEFDVRIDNTVGDKSGTISFTAQRAAGDRSIVTFTQAISAHTIAAPAAGLLVRGHGFYTIASGDTIGSTADDTDFGNVARGSVVIRTFEIKNTGLSNINITDISADKPFLAGTSPISTEGGSALSLVEFLSKPVGILKPGATARLTIQFNANRAGDTFVPIKIGAITGAIGDVYRFVVGGTVIDGPKVDISVRGTSEGFLTPFPFGTLPFGLPDGPSRLYNGQDPGLETLLITNLDTRAIDVGKAWVGKGFAVVRQPDKSRLQPGETATFDVRLKTDLAGVFNTNVFVQLDNLNKPPVSFPITGSVVGDQATGALGGDTPLDYRNDIDPIGYTPRKTGQEIKTFVAAADTAFNFRLRRTAPPKATKTGDTPDLNAGISAAIYADTNKNGKRDDGLASKTALVTLVLPKYKAGPIQVKSPITLKKGSYIVVFTVSPTVTSDRFDLLIGAALDLNPKK